VSGFGKGRKMQRFWGMNKKILQGIKFYDEIQDVLLDIETSEAPHKNILQLFAMYITQEASTKAGMAVWLCCLSFSIADDDLAYALAHELPLDMD